MKIFLGSIVLVSSVLHAAENVDVKRCMADLPGEIPVYSSDFKWNMSLDEIKTKATEMYKSEKRLAKRAYYDENLKTFVFPEDPYRGGNIRIPSGFIAAVTKHVEKAFQRGYVDALIFPDMGHSHFLVPMDYYKKEISPLPVEKFNLVYEKMMGNKDLKVVYHTAEQLRVMDENKVLLHDKKLQWRYYTRNLVGHNNSNPDIELINATESSAANTVGEVSGYYWWGGGFNIHASKNGCFAFKMDGKTIYFDLSLQDLAPSPDSGGLSD